MARRRWSFRVHGREVVFAHVPEGAQADAETAAGAGTTGALPDDEALRLLDLLLMPAAGADRSGELRHTLLEMLEAGGYQRLDLQRYRPEQLAAPLRALVIARSLRSLDLRRRPRAAAPAARASVDPEPAPPPRRPPSVSAAAPTPAEPPPQPEFAAPSAQAAVMRLAARDGIPFCEECARAAARRAPAPAATT